MSEINTKKQSPLEAKQQNALNFTKNSAPGTYKKRILALK